MCRVGNGQERDREVKLGRGIWDLVSSTRILEGLRHGWVKWVSRSGQLLLLVRIRKWSRRGQVETWGGSGGVRTSHIF